MPVHPCRISTFLPRFLERVATVVIVAMTPWGCVSKRADVPKSQVVRREGSEDHQVLSPVGEAPSTGRLSQTARDLVSSPHLALGIPTDADPSDDLLLDEHEFVVSYNPKRLNPNWVSWRLDRSHLGNVRRKNNFRADESLPVNVYHVTPRDYVRSGFDRGHLCPSADRTVASEANSITFLMTNMVPQAHELNAGPWEKLEEHERDLVERPDAAVFIVAGPVFDVDPPKIGNGVAVPRALFKIIVVLKSGQTANDVAESTEVIAAVMPNERGVGRRQWTDFVMSVDEVESETQYDFLSAVPDAVQNVIEARK